MPLGFTYDDFRIRVAEYLGVSYKGTDGLEKPQLPTSAFDLDVVSRVVNDGYERFISDFNWEFMSPLASITFVSATTGTIETGGTGTFTDTTRTEATGTFNGQNIKITATDGSSFVTEVLTSTAAGVFTFADGTLVFTAGETYSISTAVDGSNNRYLFPEDYFGVLLRDITYGLPQGSPLLRLSQRSEDEIRALESGGTETSGDPTFFAQRPIEVDDAPRWEMILWPRPQTLRTLFYRYRRFPVALTVGTQLPITGKQHDQALLACCKAEAERQRFDKVGIEDANYQKRLEASKMLDREARPKMLGDYGDTSENELARFPNGLVDTFDDTSITD